MRVSPAKFRSFADGNVQSAGSKAITGPRANVDAMVSKTSGIGKSILAASEKATNLYVAKQKEDGDVLATKAFLQLKEETQKDIAHASANYSTNEDGGEFSSSVNSDDDRDGSSYTDYVTGGASGRIDQYSARLENPYAQEQFNKKAASYLSSVNGTAIGVDSSLRLKARVGALVEIGEAAARLASANPAEANGAIDDFKESIDKAQVGGLNKKETFKQGSSRIAYSAMLSMARQDPTEVEKQLDDTTNPLTKYLTPAHIETLRTKVDTEKKRQKSRHKASVNAQSRDYLASVATFGEKDERFEASYRVAHADNPEVVKQFNAQVETREFYYDSVTAANGTLLEKRAAMDASLSSEAGDTGLADRQAVKSAALAELDRTIVAANKDPVAYARTVYADELEGLEPIEQRKQVTEFQQKDGLAPTMLAVAERKQINQQLLAADPKDVLQIVSGLVTEYEGHTYADDGQEVDMMAKALDELSTGDKALPSTYRLLIGAVRDQKTQLAQDLAGVLQIKPDEWRSTLESDGYKAIQKATGGHLVDFKQAVAQGGPARARDIDALQGSIEKLASYYASQGHDTAAASQLAYDNLVGDRYAVIEKNGLLVPKDLPGLKRELTSEGIKTRLALRRETLATAPETRDWVRSFMTSNAPSYFRESDAQLTGIIQASLENASWITTGDQHQAVLRIPVGNSFVLLRKPDGSLYKENFAKLMNASIGEMYRNR